MDGDPMEERQKVWICLITKLSFEIQKLQEFFKEHGVDINIGRLASKCTAIGNMISCNDHAAIVSPRISEIETIKEVLDVRIVQREIAGHDEVGACCIATNKGFLIHPGILKGDGLTGSVNLGFPFIKSGLVANSNGYLTGARTTGIELGRIDEALGFLD